MLSFARLQREMAASGAAAVDRRGKLSLKRKRNAEFSGEDDAVVSISGQSRIRTSEEGIRTDRFPNGQPYKARIRPPGQGSTAQTHHAVKQQVICNRTNHDSNQHSPDQEQTRLPDLPAWYGLKEKEAESQTTKTEIIRVGDVSIEWHPLPKYCHLCLVRSKHTRAAERRGFSGTSAGVRCPKARDTAQSFAQSVQNVATKLHSSSFKAESPHGTLPHGSGMGDVSEELTKDSDREGEISQQKSTPTVSPQSPHLSKSNLGTVYNTPSDIHNCKKSIGNETQGTQGGRQPKSAKKSLSLSATKQSSESKVSNPKLPQKHTPAASCTDAATSSKKSDSDTFKTESPLSRNEKQEAKEDSNVGVKILKMEPEHPVSSQIKKFSKAEVSSPQSKTTIHKVLLKPKVASISKGTTELKTESVNAQQRGTSFEKILHTSTPVSAESAKFFKQKQKAPSSSKLSRKYDLASSTNQLKSATSSHTSLVSASAVSSFQQEKQNSKSSLSEIIVIDSDDEKETLPPLPSLLPSSLSTNSKRKLLEMSGDTDDQISKKPKLINSASDQLRSLAAMLKPKAKSLSTSESSSSQFEQQFGGQNKPQIRLDSMLVRTTKTNSSLTTQSKLQTSSLGKSFAANQGSPSLSKPVTSSTKVREQAPSSQAKHTNPTSLHSSIKKGSWNLSSNVKPLFKTQRSEKPDAASVNNAKQVPSKVEADSFKSSFPNPQTQKVMVSAKGAGDARKSNQNVVYKGAAAALIKPPQGKMSSFSWPAPDANPGQNAMPRQPRNQSTFQLDRAMGPLAKPKENLPSTSQQNASIRAYTGFQTARDVQTHQDIYPKRDNQTHPAKNIQPNRGAYPKLDSGTNQGTGHPKQAVKSSDNIALQSAKQDVPVSKANLVTYQYLNQDTKESTYIPRCPLCHMQFPESLTSFQRDRHIAVCLSDSTDDINW